MGTKTWIDLRVWLMVLLICPCLSFAQHRGFDIRLLDRINPDTLTSSYEKIISHSAYVVPVVVTAAEIGYGVLANDPASTRYGVETAISVVVGQGISAGLKHLFNRPRPYESWPDVIHPINFGTGPSFPSGHTTLAFSTAASMAFSRKQWFVTLPVTLWAGSVGYSRMYLGRHYPTDVLGGLIVGFASGLLGHWITGRLYGD